MYIYIFKNNFKKQKKNTIRQAQIGLAAPPSTCSSCFLLPCRISQTVITFDYPLGHPMPVDINPLRFHILLLLLGSEKIVKTHVPVVTKMRVKQVLIMIKLCNVKYS